MNELNIFNFFAKYENIAYYNTVGKLSLQFICNDQVQSPAG